MRIIILLLATVAVFSVLSLPDFRHPDGSLDAIVCLVFAGIAAIAVYALAWQSAYRCTAGWFAVFILAHGAILQLIFAGPTIHYQHLRLVQGELPALDKMLYAFLVGQLLLVVYSIRKYWSGILGWLRDQFGPWRTLILIGILFVFSAFPSSQIQAYILELVLAFVIAMTQLATLVLGVMALPKDQKAVLGDRISRFLQGRPEGPLLDRLVLICAVWAIVIAALLSVYSYQRHAHVPDEMAYIFHARYFAAGQLSVPVPPVPQATEAYLMDCNQERCISPVPPGWPAMLALGERFGAGWLVNPLLAGVNVILLYLVAFYLYGRMTARIAALLLSMSPWFLLVSMSFMTHTFSLACALVAALGMIKVWQRKPIAWAMLSGAFIGILGLTRPLEGLMVALVLGLASLFIPGKRFRFMPTLALVLFTALVGGLTFPYNKAMTGDAATFPIMAYADKVLGPGVNSLGFGPEKGMSWGGLDPFPGHGLKDVIVNAIVNIDAMNIELFGWSTGSLLLVFVFILLRRKRDFIAAADGWLLGFIAVIFALQSLYWFSGGPDFGARYYFLAVIPLVLLSARSIDALGHRFQQYGLSVDQGRGLVALVIAVLSVSAIINFLPWRGIDKYYHYREMQPGVREIISENNIGKSLILINGKDHPDLNSALIYSELDPYGDGPVIAWNRSPEVRDKLLQAYPNRPIWVIDGPSVSGAGYRVRMGPVKSEMLEAD